MFVNVCSLYPFFCASLFLLSWFSVISFWHFHFPAVSNPGASTAKGGPRQNVDVTSLPMWRGEKVSETRNSERERIGWRKNENTMRKRCVTKPIEKRKWIFASMISHRWRYQTHVVSLALSKMCWETSCRTTIFFHQLLDGFCFSPGKGW